MAEDLGIDLRRVRGSENGGRIILADLKAYVQGLIQGFGGGRQASAPSEPQTQKPAPESIDFSKWGSVKKTPMTTLRKAISNKMVESWTTIPHVTQQDTADITAVMALRKKFVEKYEKKGGGLTLTVIILKALAKALKKHPKFTVSLDEATQEIVSKEYIHIGIAVDTEQGLIVPVLRDVDKKSPLQVAKDLQDLAEKTRTRKIAAEDLKGGTFTISNQGGIGGGFFTPVINKPEVGILGIGKGNLTPVVVGKEVENRMLLPLSLSYDHRLIDGGDAVRFLNDVVKEIQEFPAKDLEI
jgi:pyruvate dehydrogenase E2 component (dihydrolipoamide acetyltransferase)